MQPEIDQQWIYTMMITGWIGIIVHLLIISISIRHTQKKKQNKLSRIQIILNFSIWICNLIACVEWATLRTSLFLHLNQSRCKICYISNYLFYMIGKYALHLLLFYRLYFVFRKTNVKFKQKYLFVIWSIITINFITFTALWINTAMTHVTVGVLVPNSSVHVCTMFNSNQETVSHLDRLWPMLLGGQDLIVGLFTLILFMYKISEFHRNKYDSFCDNKTRVRRLMVIMRKLCVLGTMSIISTFIFYTFAIPFYGNLTFLLPVDASINSLCTVLLFGYTGSVYRILCCVCDRCVVFMLNVPDHVTERELATHSRNNTHTRTENTVNTVNTYHLHSISSPNVELPPPPTTKSEQQKNQHCVSNGDVHNPQMLDIKSLTNVNLHYRQQNKPLSLADSRNIGFSSSSFF